MRRTSAPLAPPKSVPARPAFKRPPAPKKEIETPPEPPKAAVAVPLFRLLRTALDDLKRCRADYHLLLESVRDGWAQVQSDRKAVEKSQDKLAVALSNETVARLDAETRRDALAKELRSIKDENLSLGKAEKKALALKAAREEELARLKKADAAQADKTKQDEEVGRQLAETRVQLSKALEEKRRALAELKRTRQELLELKRAEKSDAEELLAERDDLAAGLAQRSLETVSLTEALRAREATEAAAKREAALLRVKLDAFEEESARMKYEREQMRSANARMQSLLGRLRENMGHLPGLVAYDGAGGAAGAGVGAVAAAAAAGTPMCSIENHAAALPSSAAATGTGQKQGAAAGRRR